jgi:hypothetical protein
MAIAGPAPLKGDQSHQEEGEAAQVVTNWIQLIVKQRCRPVSQSAGMASGSQARITF